MATTPPLWEKSHQGDIFIMLSVMGRHLGHYFGPIGSLSRDLAELREQVWLNTVLVGYANS